MRYGVWTRTEWRMASQRTAREANIEPTFCSHMHVRGGSNFCVLSSLPPRTLPVPWFPRYIGYYIKSSSEINGKRPNIHTLVAGLNIMINLRHSLPLPPTSHRISVSKHCIGHYHPAIFNPPPHPLQKQSTKSINNRERDRGPRWRKQRIARHAYRGTPFWWKYLEGWGKVYGHAHWI